RPAGGHADRRGHAARRGLRRLRRERAVVRRRRGAARHRHVRRRRAHGEPRRGPGGLGRRHARDRNRAGVLAGKGAPPAGSSVRALPTALAGFARALPLTHALALMRYGLLDRTGSGLHDIWGFGTTTQEAWMSLAVVAAFAAVMIGVAVRVFRKASVQ